MQAISLGHAGILIRTGDITIVCDPWFEPAFFGSWFVFPRNDELPGRIMKDVCNPDFLYVSHLHGDHFDAMFLREKVNKDTTVLLPDFPSRELEREFNKLGFRRFERTLDGMEREISAGVTIAIHVETSITDGPGGDSALVVSDGESRLVNQNDCRPGDMNALAAHGPVDLHWLQFSGAIWYPMVYDMAQSEKKRLCAAKVESQFARAIRYVESVGATTVVPSAGPPAFLDPDLFDLNMITGDEISIFPDQIEFAGRLAAMGRRDVPITIPGTTFTVTSGNVTVEQPLPPDDVAQIFDDKAAYLRRYQSDWMPWLESLKASWRIEHSDLVDALSQWWGPLLAMAPTVRERIGANCLINAVAGDGSIAVGIYVNFLDGRVETYEGGDSQPYSYRFDVARDLLEHVVRSRAVDWSNSLFLSCRFTAWRADEYNEYLYNFLKSLSVERMNRTEAEARMKSAGVIDEDGDIVIGDFIVQKRCPHRNADLSVFGEIDDGDLVCTLHGWRFSLEDGTCRNAAEKRLRVRRRTQSS